MTFRRLRVQDDSFLFFTTNQLSNNNDKKMVIFFLYHFGDQVYRCRLFFFIKISLWFSLDDSKRKKTFFVDFGGKIRHRRFVWHFGFWLRTLFPFQNGGGKVQTVDAFDIIITGSEATTVRVLIGHFN